MDNENLLLLIRNNTTVLKRLIAVLGVNNQDINGDLLEILTSLIEKEEKIISEYLDGFS